MKFGQLIEYELAKYYFPRIMKKMRQGDQFQISFLKKKKKKTKTSVQQLSFNTFWQIST